MQTSVAASIDENPQKRQLDQQCKVVLSHKLILARILKRTVSEVADMELDMIRASIEGNMRSGEVPLMRVQSIMISVFIL